MVKRQQKLGETRQQYLLAAKRYLRGQFKRLMTTDLGRSHYSHALAQAVKLTEMRFVDLGTFGAEYSTIGNRCLNYLNTGDSYELTILWWDQWNAHEIRFFIGTWGDIAEKH